MRAKWGGGGGGGGGGETIALVTELVLPSFRLPAAAAPTFGTFHTRTPFRFPSHGRNREREREGKQWQQISCVEGNLSGRRTEGENQTALPPQEEEERRPFFHT